jgi:hypothetical protein
MFLDPLFVVGCFVVFSIAQSCGRHDYSERRASVAANGKPRILRQSTLAIAPAWSSTGHPRPLGVQVEVMGRV